jgi:hypothetical protein
MPTGETGSRRQPTKDLFDLGAGVGVDFQANGDFDDDRSVPFHGSSSVPIALTRT